MSKTDPGIFKLLDDMRISMERILATLEAQTRESFLDSEARWAAQGNIERILCNIWEAAA